MIEVKFKRLHPGAVLPTKAHAGDAGFDLYAPRPFLLGRGRTDVFRLGFALEIPPGYFGLVRDRSGVASRSAYVTGGVLDHSYRGEVGVIFTAFDFGGFEVKAGDRVCQLLILPVPEVAIVEAAELSDSPRGGAGFGSTGA